MSIQPEYPWFAVVTGEALEHGDLLRGCPRFLLPPGASAQGELALQRGQVDSVVLTQSCDLAVRADGLVRLWKSCSARSSRKRFSRTIRCFAETTPGRTFARA